MGFLYGKQRAVADSRILPIHQVLKTTHLSTSLKFDTWSAALPANGVPILGNDFCGCCVFASIMHYLQLCANYTLQPLPQDPTVDETVGSYSAVTGFDPNNLVATDKGTVFAGAGGAAEYWIKNGIVCGTVKNNLTNISTVDYRNIDLIKYALTLGPLFVGAIIRNDDATSPYMWDVGNSPIDGGHMFLFTGFEVLSSGKTYFDVLTWNGMWRATDAWVLAQVDEMYSPLNQAFFNKNNIDPAGIDWNALSSALAQF